MHEDFPIKIIANLILTILGALMAVWGFYEVTVADHLIGNLHELEGLESNSGWLFMLMGVPICAYGFFNWRMSRH